MNNNSKSTPTTSSSDSSACSDRYRIAFQSTDIEKHHLGNTEYLSSQVESSADHQSNTSGEFPHDFPKNKTSVQTHGSIYELSAAEESSGNSNRSGSSNILPSFSATSTHSAYDPHLNQSNISLKNYKRGNAPTMIFLRSAEGNECSTAIANPGVNSHSSASISSDLSSSSASATQSIEVFKGDRFTSPSSNWSATTDHPHAPSGKHSLDLPDSSSNSQTVSEIHGTSTTEDPTISSHHSIAVNPCSTATENPEVNSHSSASLSSDLLSLPASATQSIEVFTVNKFTSEYTIWRVTPDHMSTACGKKLSRSS